MRANDRLRSVASASRSRPGIDGYPGMDKTARCDDLGQGARAKEPERNYRVAHRRKPDARADRPTGAVVLYPSFDRPEECRVVNPFKIAVIPGDGIGLEVIPEGLKVARAAGADLDTAEYDLGGRRFLTTGEVLPDKVLEELRDFDAILLGAVGAPEVPPGVLERGLLLRLRFELDLYVNLRPFVAGASVGAGVPIDIAVIRENTEGAYAGEGGFLRKGTEAEIATQGSVNTRFGVERCVRFAFDLAQSRTRRHLTLVHKTNVLTFSGDLWQRTFDQVALEYPDVSTAYNHIDAACIYCVESPQRYDVVVTDNLFGDILTDLAGAIAGGIGRAASGNLNPARTGPSMFEPVHGSAPDIAGTGRADPTAAIVSTAMMLDFLGATEAAGRITRAVSSFAISEPGPRRLTTSEIGDAIADHIAAERV
jgi:3-isopropylmalate dehydrogenase